MALRLRKASSSAICARSRPSRKRHSRIWRQRASRRVSTARRRSRVEAGSWSSARKKARRMSSALSSRRLRRASSLSQRCCAAWANQPLRLVWMLEPGCCSLSHSSTTAPWKASSASSTLQPPRVRRWRMPGQAWRYKWSSAAFSWVSTRERSWVTNTPSESLRWNNLILSIWIWQQKLFKISIKFNKHERFSSESLSQ
jgi:hypothetical protein